MTAKHTLIYSSEFTAWHILFSFFICTRQVGVGLVKYADHKVTNQKL